MWREERASRWAKGRLEKESNIKTVKKAITEINHKSKPKETGNRNRYDQDVPQEASLTVISQQKTICPGLNNLTFKKKKARSLTPSSVNNMITGLCLLPRQTGNRGRWSCCSLHPASPPMPSLSLFLWTSLCLPLCLFTWRKEGKSG